MEKEGRYDTIGLTEDQYEPGSGNTVLKNLLGIKSKEEMEQIETLELERVTNKAIDFYDRGHRFTAGDICDMHRWWLGSIFEWAGHYRKVMMSKGGFPFAAPLQIPQLMAEFERKELTRLTPCNFASHEEVAEALAVVHTELMLIHPFREGNGRLGRLLSILMALQADLPPLDFSIVEGKKKAAYIEAVQAGMDRDYRPMTRVFSEVISRTLYLYES
jgi:cell filamentation protein